MKIFIVGSGKLAHAIWNAHLSFPSCGLLKWESHNKTLDEKAIIVHAGSGRQLDECMAFCERTKSVFIELSTGLETERTTPNFPLIVCPNTSILLLKTMRMIKANGGYFKDYDISITESHQSTKKTEPGTAFAFADALKVPHDKIKSIRDPEVQRNEIGIPDEFLDKHAYHKIVMKDGADEITFETKVLGHSSYATGVKRIIEAVLNHQLENGNHTVLDLIEQNMF